MMFLGNMHLLMLITNFKKIAPPPPLVKTQITLCVVFHDGIVHF
jgi:hypothetical protein